MTKNAHTNHLNQFKAFFGHLRFITGVKFDVNRPQEVMQWQNMTVDAIHAISLQFPATSG